MSSACVPIDPVEPKTTTRLGCVTLMTDLLVTNQGR